MLKTNNPLSNQQGMAIMELIPILIIMVLLINYSLGFFGAIHTGILNSMAARNYAFSTFNHRADLTYFRDTTGAEVSSYDKAGLRFHATNSDSAIKNQGQPKFWATERPIDFLGKAEKEGSSDVHNNKIYAVIDGKRNPTNGVSPIWVRPQYGICLNSDCAAH